jgi:hypothetical protein
MAGTRKKPGGQHSTEEIMATPLATAAALDSAGFSRVNPLNSIPISVQYARRGSDERESSPYASAILK